MNIGRQPLVVVHSHLSLFHVDFVKRSRVPVQGFRADHAPRDLPVKRFLHLRSLAGIVRDLFEMLEPGYEQPGHLLVFTDDRHIDRANVLMFQTPAIIPVVQIMS